MKISILHENKGRIRAHLDINRMTLQQAECIEEYFKQNAHINKVTVYDKTCDIKSAWR